MKAFSCSNGMLHLVVRCSDNCNVKKKMLHSSTEDAVKKAVSGVPIKIQANDCGDLDYQTILKDIKRGK